MQITGRDTHRNIRNRSTKVPAIARTTSHPSGYQRQPLSLSLSDAHDSLPTSRALVPVHNDTAPIARPVARAGRMSAPLVTHLVATRMGMPQTRARRRASVDHVNNVYQNVTRAPHVPPTGTNASKYL
jgi:hypothetical protein